MSNSVNSRSSSPIGCVFSFDEEFEEETDPTEVLSKSTQELVLEDECPSDSTDQQFSARSSPIHINADYKRSAFDLFIQYGILNLTIVENTSEFLKQVFATKNQYVKNIVLASNFTNDNLKTLLKDHNLQQLSQIDMRETNLSQEELQWLFQLSARGCSVISSTGTQYIDFDLHRTNTDTPSGS